MSNIRCWIVTDFIKEVADKLGISPTRAANLAALYQSRNPKDGDVTFDKIKDTLEKEKTALEEVDLLVPAYNTVEYDSRQDLASHDKEGNITLMKFKKGEPGAWKEDFLHRYKGSKIYSDIVKTITSAKEAYLFSLYKEMYYVQRGLEKKPEYNNAAESNAIGKVKRWKELNNKPQAEQQEVIQDPKEYTIKYIPKGKTEQEYTIRGNKIYNKHGEEVFKENSVDRNKIFAKLALSQKRAVVVSHKDKKYIVNSRNDILSVTSGKIMQWEDDNGDRKNIIALAQDKFITNQNKYTGFSQQTIDSNQINANTTTAQPVNSSEQSDDITSQVSAQEISNEDLEVINYLPNTTEARKAVRTFVLPSNLAPAIEIQEEEEDEDPPVPGVEVLNINKEDPLAKLYQDLNSAERRDRVTMLSEIFSQAVTVLKNKKTSQIERQLQEEGNKENPDQTVLNSLSSQLASLQDSDNGRRNFLKQTPLRELFAWVKNEINDYKEEAEDEYEINAYDKVLEHFDILMTQACVRIESNEGIRIIPDTVQYNNGNNVSQELGGAAQMATYEQQNLEDQTDDDEDGKRATGNDGWSFKIRELDPRTTLSAAVRKVLSNIPMTGEAALDDLGRQRYLDPDTAHAILVDKLSYMVQPEDFYNPEGKNIASKFPALNKLKSQYPWAGVLMNRLNADPRVLSQFFVDFRKDFAAFIKVKESKVMDLNMPVAIDSVVTKIKRNYEQGILLDKDSIYNTTLGIRKEAASVGKELIQEASILTEDVTQLQGKENKEDKQEVTKKLVKLLKMVGYNATSSTITNMLNDEDSQTKVDTLVANLSIIFNNLEKDSDKVNSEHLVSSLYATAYENIAEVIGEIDVLDNVQTFREGGKDRPSYTAPNYISTLIKKLSRKDLRQKVLDEEFKKYSFFHKDGEWRNEWLRLLDKKDTRREILEQLRLVELKHIEQNLGMPTAEYEDWTKGDMYSAFLAAYYSDGATGDFGYYHMPIFSDSPMSMFIRFKRYRGNYKAKLLPLFRKLVYQELDRMKLVEERREKIKKGEIKEIANYDKNGHKFHFIPALNTTTILGKTLKEAIAEHKKQGDKEAIDASIDTYVQQVLKDEFNTFKRDFFESGADERFEQMSLKGLKLKDMDAYLEEYFWNSQFATSQIIQLTVTDPAFFKNGIDFQKRFKQVYAAGNKLNTQSKYGRKTERVIYLSDEEITSASYSSIQKVLKDAVKSGRISSPIAKSIANKYKEVNATDAQALRSISSLRAVYDMMGMWTDEMEAAINNFKSGTWTGEDFDVVWQTIKPFLYTQVAKPSGREGEDIKVPHQNKNSEFLLLHTFNYIAAATSSSPQLRALTAFMEDNDIDVVMFESAVKCGGQGIINIAYSNDRLNDVIKSKQWEAIDKAAKEALKDKYDKASDFKKFKAGNDLLLENGIITQDQYNQRFDAVIPDEEETRNILNKNIRKNGEIDREVVHEFPYSEYMIQQPTPEHLFDTHAKFGSQFRNLIVSDLPDDFEVTINGKLYKKKELLELYDSLIIENLLDSWDTVTKIFGSIENLQQKLLSIVKGNPKYGRDFVDALQLVPHPTDSKKKVFNIPPNSPNMTAKYQELILSVFKNTITKQEIRGGNAILVSNFGFTRKLKLLFNEDGSIKGCECYLPAYSKKFYEPFMKENGELDINAMPEDLKKIIGYRIPTEGKYSMMPLYVKGFLPQQNGSAIMLPADLTQIAGSDFDKLSMSK